MIRRTATLTLSLALFSLSTAQEDLTELRETAGSFVSAYNTKNLEEMVALFTIDAEMVNDSAQLRLQGVEEIADSFAESFDSFPDRQVSLDVSSVRLLTASVAIEEGVAHFSDPEDPSFLDSVPYSATLVREEDASWRIAHSHAFPSLNQEPDRSLLDAVAWLEGEWTMRAESMTMNVSLVRSDNGVFYLGDATTTLFDGDSMETSLRIGFDPERQKLRWWTFDEAGGYASGTWSQEGEDGNQWRIETRGVTSSGEANSATQRISYENGNTLIWQSSNRMLDGESLEDVEFRLVRMPPTPKVPSDD